jgi:hypothetical protein
MQRMHAAKLRALKTGYDDGRFSGGALALLALDHELIAQLGL